MPQDGDIGSENAVIEASYRLVADADAFHDLMVHWVARIDRVDTKQIARLNAPNILAHMKNAADLFDQVAPTTAEDPIALAVLDTPGPAMVFARDGTVLALNAQAEEKWGLAAGRIADFGFVDISSHKALAMVRASAGRATGRQHAILRLASDTGARALAECSVIRSEEAGRGVIALRSLELHWNDGVSETLAEAFALSEAEVEVCRLLLDTRKVEEIAARRGTSVKTTRHQLSTIFAKTETSTQVDLIRLIALLCAHRAHSAPDLARGWRDPYEREEVFRDDRGRRIAFSWTGDPHGRPALFVHGMGAGYLWPEEGQAALRRAGIKLYAISRPGFGNSDAAMEGEHPIDCAARALVALRRHLDVESWPALANGAGFPVTVRAANRFDAGFDRIICTAPYLPFDKDERFANFPASRKIALRLARTSPVLADYIARFSFRAMQKRRSNFLKDYMFSDCEGDRRLAKLPETERILAAAQSLMVAQNHLSLAGDLRIVTHDWLDDLASIGLLVTILHGEQDPIVDIAWAEDIAAIYPHLDMVRVAGEGELLLLGCAPRIVAMLAEGMDNLLHLPGRRADA